MEIIADAWIDSLRMLPFLFGAFCLIECLERFSTERRNRMLMKFRKAGPIIGAAFGCIPQCGFSVVAANLYSGGIISAGTLLSVFMSTSDEAVLIMLSYPESGKQILELILTKVLVAVCAGYIVDIFFSRQFVKEKNMQHFCQKENCGCGEAHALPDDVRPLQRCMKGIILPALRHSVRLWGYILLFTVAINLAIAGIGEKRLQSVMLSGSALQPFFTALIGMIPNCASSVLLTELYMKGILSFSSVTAGLCASAGVGLAVLFKVNRPVKESGKLAGFLYALSVLAGFLLWRHR